MPHRHKVTPSAIGMIRIDMKPSDKRAGGSRSFWSRKPLYREIVAQAKRDGIMNAVANHTHYGYGNHGPVRKGCPSPQPKPRHGRVHPLDPRQTHVPGGANHREHTQVHQKSDQSSAPAPFMCAAEPLACAATCAGSGFTGET